MKKLSDVDIVFGDLADSLYRLKNQSDSPKEIRRAFTDFVNLSQKLTACMRKEYNGEWNANEFNGWTQITELFKKLRNYEQHEELIRAEIEEVSNVTFPAKDGWPSFGLGMSHTIKDVDQLSNSLPESGLKIIEADPETGIINNNEVECSISSKYIYKLSISQKTKNGKPINKLLNQIKSLDIHYLTDRCFIVLQDYYDFYKQKLHRT
jgi:hypothetical protein